MTAKGGDGVDDLPGPLLRKIAHDIVGPTGVAAGALKELERALGDDRATHAPMMNLALRSLQRLERLAKRLRLTALLHNGAVLELESEPLSLRDVVVAAVAHATTLDGRKNVTMDGPDVAADLFVRADREHLTIALAELVSNALRFARKSTRVTAAREGDVVVVVVEDDGPGFPEGLAEALAPGGTPPPREAGLALPVAAALATRFGGRIVLGTSSLVAAKDKRPGASVRFELPAPS